MPVKRRCKCPLVRSSKKSEEVGQLYSLARRSKRWREDHAGPPCTSAVCSACPIGQRSPGIPVPVGTHRAGETSHPRTPSWMGPEREKRTSYLGVFILLDFSLSYNLLDIIKPKHI